MLNDQGFIASSTLPVPTSLTRCLTALGRLAVAHLRSGVVKLFLPVSPGTQLTSAS